MLLWVFCLLVALAPSGLAQERYDVVLAGGRVMDPETGLDAVRNVGIRGDRIVEISSDVLLGDDVVDVSGLVVAPGFIDLHAHGQTNAANEYQVHDGVTTVLELESGSGFVGAWLASRTGQALINFGATVSQRSARWMGMAKYADQARQARAIVADEGLESARLGAVFESVFPSRYESMTRMEIDAMEEIVSAGIAEGALGVGVPVGYYGGATREEIFRVYQLGTLRQQIVSHIYLNYPH